MYEDDVRSFQLKAHTISKKHKNWPPALASPLGKAIPVSLPKELDLVDRAPEGGGGKFGSFTEPGPATTNFKKRSDLLGKNTFPGHARVPL